MTEKTLTVTQRTQGKGRCQSCEEQHVRYTLTLTNLHREVLDTANLCLDCLASVKVLDVIAPHGDMRLVSDYSAPFLRNLMAGGGT